MIRTEGHRYSTFARFTMVASCYGFFIPFYEIDQNPVDIHWNQAALAFA